MTGSFDHDVGGVRRRLLDLANERGISLAALSGLIERNASYLQQFIRKGSPRKLEENDRRTLAQFFGVDEGELGAPEENSSGTPKSRRRGEWVEIPRLALSASAGPGALGDGEEMIGAFGFSAKWLHEQNLEAAMLSAIAVSGDSMEPLLCDGDEILVDRRPNPPREGIYVLRWGDALLVKRVQFGKPGELTLVSANPAYPPQTVSRDEIEIIGRVVWKSGRL